MDWLRRKIGTETDNLNTILSDCKKVTDVGILGFEFYYPRTYVLQEDLEKFDNVSTGKYTVGLGQTEMVFCTDTEDICSLALTVTASLLENYEIDENFVGYLEVGTETLIDKSKSVKTVLMDLFPNNKCLEGADVKNACYGGTQALFHAVDWVQANYEIERKFAIVVCADIAIYKPGPARCTGGAGAIAFLIGPNAPLVFERGLRTLYSNNVYDFYKPICGQSVEYAIVDGTKSVDSYLSAVDFTYEKFNEKALKLTGKSTSLSDFYAVLFHSPFSKLTQKALARFAFYDFLHNQPSNELLNLECLESLRNVPKIKTFSRDFISKIVDSSHRIIDSKLNPFLEFNKRLGNMYTPSLYAQLVNVVCKNENLNDKRILLFSYGSGCIASLFSLKCKLDTIEQKKSFENLHQSAVSAYKRLEQRIKCSPDEFVEALKKRENLISKGESYTPSFINNLLVNSHSNYINYKNNCLLHDSDDVSALNLYLKFLFFPGTFYLKHIDENYQRFYSRVLSLK